MNKGLHILLVGYGKMGSALHEGWKSNPNLRNISILDPKLGKNLTEIQKPFDIIVLAVKPQAMSEVCHGLKKSGIYSSLIISIAAGKSIEFFEEIFGANQSIIRAMPNTPALIRLGMTVAISNGKTSPQQVELADLLLSAVGKVEWVEDEEKMDAVTAVSGSGPAYVFLLLEELAKAGIAQGLPEDLAMKLAKETVIGSAMLVAASPETAETLRQNVTSSGGTTEAALKVLMADDGLGQLMNKAVDAATQRSRALS